MEKKEIKISLFSFYVLMAGIVVLIGAVILGWMAVGNRNIQQEEKWDVMQNQEDKLSETEATTILGQMYSVAESIYGYEKFELVENEELVSDKYFWNYEVKNYDLIMEQYFTENGKQQFESKQEYQKIVVQDGKTYLYSDANTSSSSYFENMEFENIEISNNKIEADITAILMYTPGDVSEYSRNIKTKFVIVKEKDSWKIENYTDRRKDLEWQDTSIKVENSNIDTYQIGCIEDPVWNTDYEGLAKRIRTDLQIKYDGNSVYLKANDVDYYNNRMIYGIGNCKFDGDYLVNGINANNIKESTIGFITREQEIYLCLMFLTKQGEVYYYSDYLSNSNEIQVQKLNISNVIDIEPGYFNIYSETEIIGEYQDMLIITTDGKYYSFEDLIRVMQ